MTGYTVDELRALPTIKAGPVNDLKVETGSVQVWVRRDGQPAITVKGWTAGRWEPIGTYRAELPPAVRLSLRMAHASAGEA